MQKYKHLVANSVQQCKKFGRFFFIKATNPSYQISFPFKSSGYNYNNILCYLYHTFRCLSHIGMIGNKQVINIGTGCEYKGLVQHEILHALGRVHEQSRPDRDFYVRINEANIQQGTLIKNYTRLATKFVRYTN